MYTQITKQVIKTNWKNTGKHFNGILRNIPKLYRSFYKIAFGTTNMGFLFSSVYVHLYALFTIPSSNINIDDFLRKQAWSMLNLDETKESDDKKKENKPSSKKSSSETETNDGDGEEDEAVAGEDMFKCYIKAPEDEEVRIKEMIEQQQMSNNDAKIAYCLNEDENLFGIVSKDLDIDTFVDRINERTAFYIFLFNELAKDSYLGLKTKLKTNLIKLYRTNNQQFTYKDVPFKFNMKKVKSILNTTSDKRDMQVYKMLKETQKEIIINNYKTAHMTNLYLTDPEKYLEKARYLT